MGGKCYKRETQTIKIYNYNFVITNKKKLIKNT